MTPKHMKLLLAALALLLALAATFAHAECDTIPFCERCRNPTSCDECKAGYSLAYPESDVCTSLCRVINCEKCSTSEYGTCDKCLPGYEMSATSGFCYALPCKTEWCTQCASEDICATCADGFELSEDKGACILKDDYCFVPHCKSCDVSRYLNCEECSWGYVLTDSNTLCSGAAVHAGAATTAAVAALVLATAALTL